MPRDEWKEADMSIVPAQKTRTHVVILAGGNGERLWPYAHKNKPKYLLPFRQERSLLVHTINRVRSFADVIWIVTHQDTYKLIQAHIQDPSIAYIAEPATRDTAAAMLCALLRIQESDPYGQVVMVPADHYVPQKAAFSKALTSSSIYAMQHNIVSLLGLQVRYPTTKYGYIQIGTMLHEKDRIYRVAAFYEKPDMAIARAYSKQTDMFWNLGIVIGEVSVLIMLYEHHAPQYLAMMKRYYATKNSCYYDQLPSISFDHLILSCSNNLVVQSVSFIWSDVGTLATFMSLQPLLSARTRYVGIDAMHNLVDVADKTVVCVGVSDVCVVEHEGVLVIVSRDRVDALRELAHRNRTGDEVKKT